MQTVLNIFSVYCTKTSKMKEHFCKYDNSSLKFFYETGYEHHELSDGGSSSISDVYTYYWPVQCIVGESLSACIVQLCYKTL